MSRRWLATVLVIAACAAPLALLAAAADPGSKEDPLATVTYVGRYAQFNRVDLAAGQSLRLGTGAEFALAEPLTGEVAVRELDLMRDTVLDLTDGAPLALATLRGCHHYINASGHDIFLRPEEEVVMLLRGEWK